MWEGDGEPQQLHHLSEHTIAANPTSQCELLAHSMQSLIPLELMSLGTSEETTIYLLTPRNSELLRPTYPPAETTVVCFQPFDHSLRSQNWPPKSVEFLQDTVAPFSQPQKELTSKELKCQKGKVRRIKIVENVGVAIAPPSFGPAISQVAFLMVNPIIHPFCLTILAVAFVLTPTLSFLHLVAAYLSCGPEADRSVL